MQELESNGTYRQTVNEGIQLAYIRITHIDPHYAVYLRSIFGFQQKSGKVGVHYAKSRHVM